MSRLCSATTASIALILEVLMLHCSECQPAAVTFTSGSQLRRRAQISFDVGHDGDDAAISYLVLPIREYLFALERPLRPLRNSGRRNQARTAPRQDSLSIPARRAVVYQLIPGS
jgi:hypothetical protein